MHATDTMQLNDTNFEQTIAGAGRPVLVDFWAEWCMPCRVVGPTVDQIAADYAGRATVAKVNLDQAPQAAARMGITAIPTLLVFKDGQVVDRLVGVVPKDTIAAALDKAA